MIRVLRRAGLLAALLAASAVLAVTAHRAFAGNRHEDARPWTQALALVALAERTRGVIPSMKVRDEAVARFHELARTGPASARSRAATIEGLLQLENAGPDTAGRQQRIQLSVAALRSAVRLDPANDDAAYDLELILSKSAQSGHPIREPKKARKKPPAKGHAGSAPPGAGY